MQSSSDSSADEAPEAHFHFKPDKNLFGNGVFKVLGLCWDAQKGREDKEPVVIFSPIREPRSPLPVTKILLRLNLSDFFDSVEWEDTEPPHFARIRDPEVYEQLKKVRDKMCVEIKLVSTDHSDA